MSLSQPSRVIVVEPAQAKAPAPAPDARPSRAETPAGVRQVVTAALDLA